MESFKGGVACVDARLKKLLKQMEKSELVGVCSVLVQE